MSKTSAEYPFTARHSSRRASSGAPPRPGRLHRPTVRRVPHRKPSPRDIRRERVRRSGGFMPALFKAQNGLTSEGDNTPLLAVPAKQTTGLRNDRPPRSGLGRNGGSKPASFRAQNGLEIHQNKRHGARPEAPGVSEVVSVGRVDPRQRSLEIIVSGEIGASRRVWLRRCSAMPRPLRCPRRAVVCRCPRFHLEVLGARQG